MTLEGYGGKILGKWIGVHVVCGAVEDLDHAFGDALAKGHDAEVDVLCSGLYWVFGQHSACAIVFEERCRACLGSSCVGEDTAKPDDFVGGLRCGHVFALAGAGGDALELGRFPGDSSSGEHEEVTHVRATRFGARGPVGVSVGGEEVGVGIVARIGEAKGGCALEVSETPAKSVPVNLARVGHVLGQLVDCKAEIRASVDTDVEQGADVLLVLLSAFWVWRGRAIRGFEEGAWLHGREDGGAVLHSSSLEELSYERFLSDVCCLEVVGSRDIEAHVFADRAVICALESSKERSFEVVGGGVVRGAEEDIVYPDDEVEMTSFISPFLHCVR